MQKGKGSMPAEALRLCLGRLCLPGQREYGRPDTGPAAPKALASPLQGGWRGVSCPFSFLHILLLGSIGGVGFFHNPLGFLLYQERRSFVPAQVPDGLTSLSPLSVPPGPAPLTANRLFQPYHTLPLPCSSYLSTHKNMQKRPPEWEVFFCFIPGSIAQRGSAV